MWVTVIPGCRVQGCGSKMQRSRMQGSKMRWSEEVVPDVAAARLHGADGRSTCIGHVPGTWREHDARCPGIRHAFRLAWVAPRETSVVLLRRSRHTLDVAAAAQLGHSE
jgi:hypothetical protein